MYTHIHVYTSRHAHTHPLLSSRFLVEIGGHGIEHSGMVGIHQRGQNVPHSGAGAEGTSRRGAGDATYARGGGGEET